MIAIDFHSIKETRRRYSCSFAKFDKEKSKEEHLLHKHLPWVVSITVTTYM